MSDLRDWDSSAINNSDAPPNGFPEGQAPGTVNDSSRELMAAVRRQHEQAEWIDKGWNVERVTATQFRVLNANVTSDFTQNRRLRFTDTVLLYGDVVNVSYSAPHTIVDVQLDTGSLTESLSAVSVGIVNRENSSLRGMAFANAGIGLQQDAGNNVVNINWASLSSQSAPDVDQSTIAIRTGFVHYETPLSAIAGGIAGSADGLITEATTSPFNEVRVVADSVVLKGSDGALLVADSVNQTADLRNSGVGGLDIGSKTIDTWYCLYVISDGASVGAIFSESFSYGVTKPTGWNYLARVGARYVGSDNNIVDCRQRGKYVAFKESRRVRNENQSSNQWQGMLLDTEIPVTADRVNVVLGCDTSGRLGVSPFDNGVGGSYFTLSPGGDSTNFANALQTGRAHTVSAWVQVPDNRRIYTYFGANPVTIHVTGYELG